MLYYVKPNDTLYRIARKFNTTVNNILMANVICNPNLIYVGEPILIPETGITLPRAGATPYYVVLPGDTLGCIANNLNTSVEVLTRANNIIDPNTIFAGSELLIVSQIPSPSELEDKWAKIGNESCESINPSLEYGIFYLDSFRWEAIGKNAIPYLLELLENQCSTVRLYSVISFGRIAKNDNIQDILNNISVNDPDSTVRTYAKLSNLRIEYVKKYGRRIHVLTTNNKLYEKADINSRSVALNEGDLIKVFRWYIPSPTGEEGPRGGIQIYDQVYSLNTGRIGFLPRFGFNQITLI